jgi:hypothetical protein
MLFRQPVMVEEIVACYPDGIGITGIVHFPDKENGIQSTSEQTRARHMIGEWCIASQTVA